MSESIAREHRTVSRVTTILEAAGQSGEGVRLAALAELLSAPKSSIHVLIKGLVATGYLQQRGDAYTLGPALDALLQPRRTGGLFSARGSLDRLQSRWNETAILCKLVGSSVVYADSVESTHSIRYSAPLHRRRPLFPTSAGKCFVANFPARKIQNFLQENVAIEARESVMDELALVRKRGYAFNKGETVPDVFAVACPVVIAGHIVAAISVCGPRSRMEDRMTEIASHLQVEAALAGSASNRTGGQ